MHNFVRVAVISACLASLPASATDVINRDKKAYKLKVQSEGKLSISTYTLAPDTSLYGLCAAAFCTFEIPGSKISAKKDARLTVRGGKFVP